MKSDSLQQFLTDAELEDLSRSLHDAWQGLDHVSKSVRQIGYLVDRERSRRTAERHKPNRLRQAWTWFTAGI